MTKRQPAGAAGEILAAFFPPGAVPFLVAVLSMTLAHACLMLTAYAIVRRWLAVSDADSVYMLAFGWISMLVYVHPSFMLTRGRSWAYRFLKRISVAYIAMLSIGLAWHVANGRWDWWVPAAGLAFAALAAWMYRTNGFRRLRERYQELRRAVAHASHSRN